MSIAPRAFAEFGRVCRCLQLRRASDAYFARVGCDASCGRRIAEGGML
jgi:hypothetical protein